LVNTNDVQGLVVKAVEAILLKADDFKRDRNITITANFYDVCHDKVRDLCNGLSLEYFDGKKVSPRFYEDMELYQTTANESISKSELVKTGMVKNGSVVRITSLDDLDKIF
jgi:hypothetical protein